MRLNAKTAEHQRLADSEAREADWKQWGAYVSKRAWGTEWAAWKVYRITGRNDPLFLER